VRLSRVVSPRVNYTVNRPVSEKEKNRSGLPVEPTGSPRYLNYKHGFRVGTGPVHVPGRTGSTGNRPNRSGSCTGSVNPG
jgi:hypothetical protein